jgi:hypothetical protein
MREFYEKISNFYLLNMSNLSKSERNRFYPILVNRDTERCSKCGRTREQLQKKLEIHEDVYQRPLSIKNMRLLCHGCNHLKELRKKNLIRTSSITAEHKKSTQAYPLFIKWLKGEMERKENNYHLPYDQVIDQAAYDVGMQIAGVPLSPETVKRYLGPLCDHPTSPYVTSADNYGQMQLWVRGKEPTIEE